MAPKAKVERHQRKGAKPLSTVERIYGAIREMTINYELKPNASLNESELAARLHVSRTPLREALSRLVTEGMLEFYPNRAFFPRKRSTIARFSISTRFARFSRGWHSNWPACGPTMPRLAGFAVTGKAAGRITTACRRRSLPCATRNFTFAWPSCRSMPRCQTLKGINARIRLLGDKLGEFGVSAIRCMTSTWISWPRSRT